MVGYRETNLVNWGSFDDPDCLSYPYKDMTAYGFFVGLAALVVLAGIGLYTRRHRAVVVAA